MPCRAVDKKRNSPDQGRGSGLLGFGPSSISMALIIRRRMALAFGITFTSATVSVPIRTRCIICAPAAPQARLWCRLQGQDRPAPTGQCSTDVAASGRARAMLGWTPRYNDLATIIAHALAWEQRLRRHVDSFSKSAPRPCSSVA
jgi:hypothetical protein